MQSRRIFLFLIFSIFLSFAQTVAYEPNSSTLTLRIYSQVETNASSAAEFEDFLSETSIISLGSGMDLSERILLDTTRAQNSWLADVSEADDGPQARQGIEAGKYPLAILIGGPAQNSITAYGIASGWFNETHEVEGGIIVKSGKLQSGAVVVAISDRQGIMEGALQNQAARNSPLNAFIPQEYVPLAATGISLLMLILFNVGRTVFEFKALNIGRRNRKVGEGALMFRGFNLSEGLAIMGASAVLGLSISWQYFGMGGDFAFWLLVNSAICLLAAILHEVTHRVFAHLFGIRMEYRFWPAGSALTLISSFLGNAFSIQGFILEEIPPGVPKWKVGLMKLASPLVSASVMVLFAYLYYLGPDPIFKVVYSTSALWAMAEILPFGSLDGKDVKEWNHTVWFLAFCLISISYLAVTFLL